MKSGRCGVRKEIEKTFFSANSWTQVSPEVFALITLASHDKQSHVYVCFGASQRRLLSSGLKCGFIQKTWNIFLLKGCCFTEHKWLTYDYLLLHIDLFEKTN